MSTMRDQSPKGGVIQQVTSIGGQTGVPTFSIYCVSSDGRPIEIDVTEQIFQASKWAVEGFTEAVQLEVKPEWNIKFTCEFFPVMVKGAANQMGRHRAWRIPNRLVSRYSM
jgi:hypothetical protein